MADLLQSTTDADGLVTRGTADGDSQQSLLDILENGLQLEKLKTVLLRNLLHSKDGFYSLYNS